MADKEIIITIQNDIVISNDKSSSKAKVPKAVSDKNKEESGSTASEIGKLVMQDAIKKSASFAISNYGDLTGDYVTQANTQAGIELIGMGVSALSSPLGVFAVAGSIALKVANRQIDIGKKRIQTDVLRQRVGMISYNGGRG